MGIKAKVRENCKKKTHQSNYYTQKKAIFNMASDIEPKYCPDELSEQPRLALPPPIWIQRETWRQPPSDSFHK